MEKIIHYCWFGGRPLPKLAKKCIASWKKFLPDYEIKEWNENNVDLNECPFIKQAYEKKKWAFVADYVRAKKLNQYGGIYFDTDMEITKDISKLLENETFLGLEDTGYVAVGVWHEKNKNSYLTSELLKTYQAFENFDIEKMTEISIPKIITKILEKTNFKKGYNKIQILDNNITIYPRDYFYPYSYFWDNNNFTENTCMIHYYDASWLPKRDQLELFLFRRLGKANTYSLFNMYRRLRVLAVKIIKLIFFPIFLLRRLKAKRSNISAEYKERIENTIKLIEKNKNSNYITIYNKMWFGVTSSTTELFDNLVDCGEIYRKKDIKRINKAIQNTNIKQIVFSSFAIGWVDLARYLKKKNKDIKLKVFWHGSNSQVLDSYGWQRNVEFIKLHKEKIIDAIGTCKESLLNFYKKQGYNAYFVTNKVDIKGLNTKKAKSIDKQDNILIGIYAAKCDDWRKNMYSQLIAASLIENAVVDMVPLNQSAIDFAKTINLKIQGEQKSIPRKELLKRMQKNDVNLYVTFSECAPMLPLESMGLGVPCITGNNHHYFTNTELEKYLIINNETDIQEIKEKILLNIKDRDLIIKLYSKFEKENIKKSSEDVKKFLSA